MKTRALRQLATITESLRTYNASSYLASPSLSSRNDAHVIPARPGWPNDQ